MYCCIVGGTVEARPDSCKKRKKELSLYSLSANELKRRSELKA
jgi:hypothetical protein